MKRFLLSVLSVAAMASANADEGMWTLCNLDSAVYRQMVAEGFELSYDDLYKGDSALKNACVNFGGFCSGVVVSPDGLVFTNHHCGFGAINKHSTVEHDYMLNGFFAKEYADELPNEDLFVSFMKDQQDITSRVMPLVDGKGFVETSSVLDSITTLLTDSVKAIDSTLHVEVDAFYEGNKYFATTYQDFTDVRLVFCVPKSMGKFGGETDNWMWPRQTCDFSVFRVYADPETNGPAAYSENNVPYRPKRWAKVSLQGYKEGDYAMTVGYPGSTSRYLSSYGIVQRRDVINKPCVNVRDVKLAIMRKYMNASEQARIQYENKFASCANYWKNSIGMNKCIDSIGLISQKQDYEARIKEWIKNNNVNDSRYLVDFDTLSCLYDRISEPSLAYNYFFECFWRTSEFFTRAKALTGKMDVKGPSDKPSKQYVEFEDNSDKWNLALDKEMTAAMLKLYAEKVSPRFLPSFYKVINDKFGGDYDKYVDYLYKKSGLLDKGRKFYIFSKSFSKNPANEVGLGLTEIISMFNDEMTPIEEKIAKHEQKLCAARIQMEQDLPHYSDANFTMRLSYGQVGGYMLGGKPSGYYTTASSIVEKMNKANENAEYFAEPIMHELLSATDFGKYQDKTTGEMQLCFLTNNDITGGNSGSPMFDGKGRLIGLAFDGNWDSLASDILFDSHLARCIGVDIRYVLYMIDKWGHADRLIREIAPE